MTLGMASDESARVETRGPILTASRSSTSWRAGLMVLASLLVAAAVSVAGAQPASADAWGELRTAQTSSATPACLIYWPQEGRPALRAATCLGGLPGRWALEIVDWVGDSPRYRVRHMDSNRCLVAFASNGRVDTYTCNSAWADQVWGFQYVKPNPYDGDPLFWLRNKHSGRCLAANLAYATTVFMTTCAHYNDQLWSAPNN